MSEAFHHKYHTQIQHNTVDNIYIEKIDSIYDFIEQFPRIQSFITTQSIEAMPIRLLVIDNVTSLFRTYFENSARDMRRHMELINQFTSKLKEWATLFNLVVVVVIQIYDFIPSEDPHSGKAYKLLEEGFVLLLDLRGVVAYIQGFS